MLKYLLHNQRIFLHSSAMVEIIAGKSGGAFGALPQATPSRNAGRGDGFHRFLGKSGTILGCPDGITFVAVA